MKKNKKVLDEQMQLDNVAVEEVQTTQEIASESEDIAPVQENATVIDESNDFAAQETNKKGKKQKVKKQKNAQAQASSKSKAYTAISIILHILSYASIIALTSILAIECYQLVPYYSFWPFVGVILTGVLGLVFMVVTLIVTRKRSKKSIMRQTVSIVITFFCLSSGFGLLVNYVFPDIIAMATQNTIHVEDLVNNGDDQAQKNAKLERDFILYNLLNGNYDSRYSYKELSRHQEDENSIITGYDTPAIQRMYDTYLNMATNNLGNFNYIFTSMSGYKLELYNFIYNSYILNDYDYAFNNVTNRRCFALALVDHDIEIYSQLCEEGFNNERLKTLFTENFKNMNHDGYHTFDDPLLLYAQAPGRMTVPVVLRLILDDTYTYTQPMYDDSGTLIGYDGILFTMYDPDARDEYIAADGTFDEEGKGVNEKGWIIHSDGYVERPMKWCVLDMDGNVMAVTEVDLSGLSIGGMNLGALLPQILGQFPDIIDALGGLLSDGVGQIIEYAANGASLSLALCMTDNGGLAINVVPSNVNYGVLGYMQMSWVESNNLLFAVINVISTRNWLLILGSVGVVLVIAGGLCREYARKAREEKKEEE